MIEIFIAEHPLLAVLSQDAQQKLVKCARLLTLRTKKTVLRQDGPVEGVHFLISGTVRVFHREGSKELLVKLLKAPAMFGEIEAVSESACTDGVVTVEKCELLVVPVAVFRFLLEHEPSFAAAVARDLAKRLRIAAVNQSAIAFDDVETRLAGLLLDYASCAGVPQGRGFRIQAAITQSSLALDLGVSRKAVGSVLGRFREMGLLSKEDARYHLPDVSALEALRSARPGFNYRSGG